MKFLIACELPTDAIEALKPLASSVIHRPDASSADIRDCIADVAVLIVEDARVPADVLARAPALQLIVHAGPGRGDVAIEAASEQGVLVSNCPDQHAVAVAEHVFCLLLALDRRIPDATAALRAGRWDRSAAVGRGLSGRTLGLLGFDNTARQVATRAAAFGLHVVAWRPALTGASDGEPHVEFCNYPREVARRSDIIVALISADEDGAPLVNAEFLENVQPDSDFIYLGPPGALDESALADVARRRGLRVAVDAFATAPASDVGRIRSPLCELPGFVGTPAVARHTLQARNAVASEVVRIVRTFVTSGEVPHCLNLCERSPATWQLVLRVRDQVGVMASILDAIRADGINAQEIGTRVFLGARAAWCNIALDERPSTDALDAIRSLPDVLHLELRAVL